MQERKNIHFLKMQFIWWNIFAITKKVHTSKRLYVKETLIFPGICSQLSLLNDKYMKWAVQMIQTKSKDP